MPRFEAASRQAGSAVIFVVTPGGHGRGRRPPCSNGTAWNFAMPCWTLPDGRCKDPNPGPTGLEAAGSVAPRPWIARVRFPACARRRYLNWFWEQAKLVERIGDLLLFGDDGRVERLDAVGLPLECHLQDRRRDSDRGASSAATASVLSLAQASISAIAARIASITCGLVCGEFRLREVELVVRDQAGAVDERAGLRRGLGRGLERIPDCPGVDRAALEGGARIGRRQEDRLMSL